MGDVDTCMKFGNYWIIANNNVKFNDTGKNMTMWSGINKAYYMHELNHICN
jgi:hypothetical protein